MKNIFSHAILVQKYFEPAPNAPRDAVDATVKPATEIDTLFAEYKAAPDHKARQAILEKIAQENQKQRDALMTQISYAAHAGATENGRAEILAFRDALHQEYVKLEAQNNQNKVIVRNQVADDMKAVVGKEEKAPATPNAPETADPAVSVAKVDTDKTNAAVNADKVNATISLPEQKPATQVEQSVTQAERRVDSALENFEQTKNNAIVARLFGLDANFFNSSGFGGIKDLSSLQSMMVSVKHVVDTGMEIPNSRKEWEAIGYNVDGWVMQKSELARIRNFTQHVKNHPEHQQTLDYVVSWAGNNNRDGYVGIMRDRGSNRLATMAQTEASAMNIVDGKLEAAQENIVRALVGNNDANFSQVGIVDLQGALTRAIKNGHTVEQMYSRITGETLPSMKENRNVENARVKFRDALELHLALIRKATNNSNAGLDSLLQDRQEQYIQAIQNRLASGEKIEIQLSESRGMSTNVKNVLSGLFGVGVAVLTAGKVTLNAYHGREITAGGVMESVDANPEFADKLRNVAGGLANFVLGRNLKLAIGQDDFLNAFETRIKSQASEVMSLTENTDPKTIKNPDLQKAFEIAKNGGYLNQPNGLKNFQEAVITRIIDSEARGVSDYKAIWASINPIFLGVHYDRVNTTKTGTETSEANMIEGRITAIDIKNIAGVAVSQDNKTFTIASTLRDPIGAYNGDIPVLMKNANGELAPVQNTITHETPKKIHLTLTTNQGNVFYVVEFTDKPVDEPKNEQSAEVKQQNVTGEIAMTAQAENLVAGRDALRENTRTNIGESIFVMSRNKVKYANFNKALELIGQQNYTEALAMLKNGKTSTEKTLYTQFEKNPAGLVTALTFAYGNRNRNHVGDALPKHYNIAHPANVKGAENRLTQHNKTTDAVEAEFAKHPVHKPTELMNMQDIAGQALSVSVYATPRGGIHRIDKFSGSITVSDKTVNIDNKDARGEIFDRHAADAQKSLDAINAHLKSTGKAEIDMAAFKNWVVNGTLPAGITQDMVTRDAKIFETRAMIQGNLCANKTEVIAYPLLKSQPKVTPPQVESGAMSLGSTTVLTDSSVTAVNSDLGTNPWAHIEKKGEPDEPHDSSTTPTPTDKPVSGNYLTNASAGETAATNANTTLNSGSNLGNITQNTVNNVWKNVAENLDNLF